MAFDPTGEIGLYAEYEHSDILPNDVSGLPYDVVVAHYAGETEGRGFMRGYYHESRWGCIYWFEKDNATGGWKPKGTADGSHRAWIGVENSGGHYFVEYQGELVDGTTGLAWRAPVDGDDCRETELYFRYDAEKAAWRFDAFAKTLNYDFLSAGFNKTFFVLFKDGDTEGVGFTANEFEGVALNGIKYVLTATEPNRVWERV